MSEYAEKHSVARLVGAPPGYVGYEEGGQLTEAVRRRPYTVVLLDEVEKAHPEVFDVLLQVLDDGRLTDGQGRTVDFRNAILVLTSNLGSVFLVDESLSRDDKREAVMGVVRMTFKPEFLNRLDDVVIFEPLSTEELARIVDLQVERLARRLSDRRLVLDVTPAAREWLSLAGYDPVYGARPLRRLIQTEIGDRLAKGLLSGAVTDGSTVTGRRRPGRRGAHARPPPERGCTSGSRAQGGLGSGRFHGVCPTTMPGLSGSRGLMRHARTSVAPAPSAVSEPTAVAAEPWTWPEAPGLPPQARDDSPWATTEQVVPLATLLEAAEVRAPSARLHASPRRPRRRACALRSSRPPTSPRAVDVAPGRSAVRPLPSGMRSRSAPARSPSPLSRPSPATARTCAASTLRGPLVGLLAAAGGRCRLGRLGQRHRLLAGLLRRSSSVCWSVLRPACSADPRATSTSSSPSSGRSSARASGCSPAPYSSRCPDSGSARPRRSPDLGGTTS